VSNRPGARKTGGAARFIAPIALVVVAIACFMVLTNQDSDTATPAATTKAKTTTKTTTNSSGDTVVSTKKTYVVRAGDSFAAIAEKENVDVDTLQELNPDIDPRALQPGQKLKLR
jgi:LysM repeat protein